MEIKFEISLAEYSSIIAENAMAENIRRKIQARIEDIDFFNRMKGKLGDVG